MEGIKYLAVMLGILLAMPYITHALTITDTEQELTPLVLKQDNLESKLRFNYTRINATTWRIFADFDPAFKAAIQDCFTNITDQDGQTQCNIPTFKANWLADTNITVGDLISSIQRAKNMPIQSQKGSRSNQTEVNYIDGFSITTELRHDDVIQIGLHSFIVTAVSFSNTYGIMRQSNGTIWTFYKNASTSPVQLASSTNNGSTWRTNNLKLPPSNNATTHISAIIDNNDTIHAYYMTDVGTQYFRYTIINNSWYNTTIGDTATETVILAKRNGTLVSMSLMPASTIINYRESGNNGSTWSAARTITIPGITNSIFFAAVEVTEGTIDYIFNAATSQLYYGNISRTGVFSTPEIIIDTGVSGIFTPGAIAVDRNDNVHIVAGFDQGPGDKRIYYANITNSTRVTQSPGSVITDTFKPVSPTLVVDFATNTLIMAYQNADRCMITNSTFGATWLTPATLSFACTKPVFNGNNGNFPLFNSVNSSVNGTRLARIEMAFTGSNNNLSYLYVDPRSLNELPQTFLSSVTFFVYDEAQYPNRQLNATIQIVNATHSVNFTIIGNRTLNITALPQGLIDIFVSSNTQSRTYSMNLISSMPSFNYNMFLINTTTAFQFDFFTNVGGIPVNGTNISLYRNVGGNLILTQSTISTGTGVNGKASFFAEINIPYTVVVNHYLYFPQTFTQIFSVTDVGVPISINMIPSTASNVTLPPINPFINPYTSLTFVPNITYVNTGVTVNVTYIDISLLTTFSNLSVKLYNITNLTQWSYETTTATTFTLNVTLAKTGRYFFKFCTIWNNTQACAERVYVAYNATGLPNVEDIEAAGGLSVLFFRIIAFFLIVGVTAILFPFFGVGSLVMIPVFSSIGFLFRIFSLGELIIISFTSIAMLAMIARGN